MVTYLSLAGPGGGGGGGLLLLLEVVEFGLGHHELLLDLVELLVEADELLPPGVDFGLEVGDSLLGLAHAALVAVQLVEQVFDLVLHVAKGLGECLTPWRRPSP